jgi:fimbrial chaperone protein
MKNSKSPMKQGFVALAMVAVVLLIAGTDARAGQFSVTPVRVFMAPKDRAAAITITNESDEPLVMQADVYAWKQKADGEDDLVASEDLFLAPPIIKLAPRARQVVRLAVLKPASLPEQQTYRLIVREVPEAQAADRNVQVQIALAFSLPVFITHADAKRALACSVQRAGTNAATASCENLGRAYAQPRELALVDGAGAKIAARDHGGYILPGMKRAFELKGVNGTLASGNAKLVVGLDDGTSQTFDVAVRD